MAFRRWKEKENHKYIARVPLKNPTEDRQYRYFYTKEEYQAYLNGVKLTKNPNKQNRANLLQKKLTKLTDKIDKKKDLKSIVGKVLNTKTVKKGEALVGKFLKKEDAKKSYKFGDYNPASHFIEKVFKSGIGKAIVDLGYEQITLSKTEKVESLNKLKKKTKKSTSLQDQAAVNPNYLSSNDGYSMNCPYCTAAYDLRRRGYDVEASVNPKGETVYDVAKWYKGAEVVELSDVISKHSNNGLQNMYVDRTYASAAINRELANYGEGSRGHFFVWWTGGGGHDVAWEVEKGNVVLHDAQVNKTYTVDEIMSRSEYMAYIRTDNLEPTEEVLEAVRNKKRRKKNGR